MIQPSLLQWHSLVVDSMLLLQCTTVLKFVSTNYTRMLILLLKTAYQILTQSLQSSKVSTSSSSDVVGAFVVERCQLEARSQDWHCAVRCTAQALRTSLETCSSPTQHKTSLITDSYNNCKNQCKWYSLNFNICLNRPIQPNMNRIFLKVQQHFQQLNKIVH